MTVINAILYLPVPFATFCYVIFCSVSSNKKIRTTSDYLIFCWPTVKCRLDPCFYLFKVPLPRARFPAFGHRREFTLFFLLQILDTVAFLYYGRVVYAMVFSAKAFKPSTFAPKTSKPSSPPNTRTVAFP